MTSIYSQEYATKMYGKEQYAEGRQEGIKQGKKGHGRNCGCSERIGHEQKGVYETCEIINRTYIFI